MSAIIHSAATSIEDGMDAATTREQQRLAALHSFEIIDSLEEAVFNEFARLAASIAGTPMAAVSFVDAHRQWCKANLGIPMNESARESAFCARAIQGGDVLVVRDALEDEYFSKNPLIGDACNVRFYAGAPLLTADGHALGTVCVLDVVPRDLSPEQQQGLQILSRHVVAQLELRRRLANFARGDGSRQAAITSLRRAIAEDEFLLHYQPKVDMRTGRLTGFEALIRWKPAGKSLIEPAKFIPLLEETGLIVEVGTWVMQQAMIDHRDWTAQGLIAPPIAVNVSPHQLRQPDFIERLESVLGPEGSARAPLDIEITEGVLLEKTEDIVNTLQAVRSLGAQVSIDDFGTGYSSLRYLAHLPIDTLKIDRSFILAMTEDADDMAIVSSIIALAHGLDLKVVAEGVETEEQRKLLRLLRCDEMQGFLNCRPMPKNKVEEFLQAECEAITQRSLHTLDAGQHEFAERRFTRKRIR